LVADKTYIEYSTVFSKWKERIVKVSETELILKNIYKNISNETKKTQLLASSKVADTFPEKSPDQCED
jgi:hypothetical protein